MLIQRLIENRLYSMQERGEMGEGTQCIEFRYDHLSRPYWKQTFTSVAGDDAGEFVWQGSDAMTFVYDGWNCIEQTSATDTFHADFLWGTDLSGSHQHARRFVGRADGGGAAAQRVSSQVPAANQRAGGVGGLLLKIDTVTHNAEDPVFRRSYPTYDGNGNVSEHARRPVEWVDCPVGNPAGGERRAELRDQYLDSAGAVAAHFEPERSEDRLARSDKPCGWQSHQYGAFGRTTKTTSAGAGGSLPAEMDLTQLDEVHRFSTKPFGQQTGLYYYGYRYYDPVTGRWPSRDPISENFKTFEFNIYCMIRNEALGAVDVLGLGRYHWYEGGAIRELVETLNGAFDAGDERAENLMAICDSDSTDEEIEEALEENREIVEEVAEGLAEGAGVVPGTSITGALPDSPAAAIGAAGAAIIQTLGGE